MEITHKQKKLATLLHDSLCRYNHTDGCGWFYEWIDKEEHWEGHTHKKFLAAANELLILDLNFATISDILGVIKNL